MTDDLVKRLREEAADWDEPKHPDEVDVRGMLHNAADRIEAQAAEIERLRSVINDTGQHWLDLQNKHPIQWEGAIDAAMAAACAEIERLRAALDWMADSEPLVVEAIYKRAALGDTQ